MMVSKCCQFSFLGFKASEEKDMKKKKKPGRLLKGEKRK